ncbi:MAG: translocation/assembly module TamB, partial [Verrucomicrobia bacterium]|nr:translocation/assembly module TamB [Verrucomicrobiota bacterium]
EFQCDAVSLVTGDGAWALREPFHWEVVSGTNGLGMNLSPMDLVGPGSRLAVQGAVHWPTSGTGEVTVHGLRSSYLGDFLTPDLPELQVPEATLSFGWEDGPLVFDLNAQARWRQASNAVWSVAGRAWSDGQSLQVESAHVDLNDVPCAGVSGHLPLGIEPARGWGIVESSSNRVAQFDVRAAENGPLWSLVERTVGVKVESPTLEFRVRGELPAVQGELVVNAARVRSVDTNAGEVFVVPELEDVRLEAGLDLGGVELRRADARLLGQEIRARARWAIGARNWKEWWEAVRAPDWGRIDGDLRLEDAPLSALSALAPGIIAPVGRADLELSLLPPRRVHGRLTITNGATRFFKPLGALRDIEADIAWDGWQATINTFTATLGGRPVGLSGELGWRDDGEHRLDLRLTGRNLSLVRDPELFVRADLDLRLQKSFDAIALLSGDVQLQRSLLFRDFNSLLSFDRSQPEQRPPYFSIRQPPFGDWRLDVRVKGDRFLNVFSPAFKGEVSAGLQLQGTLREPIAVGAVTVDSGKVLFPFGTLNLENGRVDLTRDDPYRPRLEFRGEGRNYGYIVTVDLRGPMDAPNLTFQSVPPLNAQQILMMLTAGEIPRSDFGYGATDKAGQVGYYIGKEFVNRFIGNTSTTERLILRSGEDVTQDGKTTYAIEYLFNDRWSAFGEYDRFQNVNSGLKFKVLSK